jgi:hypothetical protein
MSRRSIAASLRRYRSEWRAALKKRDYMKTRKLAGAALSAVASQNSQDLAPETRALHELLALDRRLQAVANGEAPARLPRARAAFAVPPASEFSMRWQAAVDAADFAQASRIVSGAIAALSRQLLKRIRSQQALIRRLKHLQRKPLSFNPVPTRCAFCGGSDQPGVDSGHLFLCETCVRMAYAMLAEEAEGGK